MGAAVSPPRKRGRPKGSGNKRARDLKGFIDARYGASAAQQSAALCMITPAELKAAGGSMAKAQVNKALDLVRHVRAAQDGLDHHLRELLKEALRDLAAELPAEGEGLRLVVNGFMRRVKEATSGFGLSTAMDLIAKERAALLPYTDQRQPQAVELKGQGMAPSVVVMGAAPSTPMPITADFVEVFEGVEGEVARVKSHDQGQQADLLELPGPQPAD